MTASQFFFQGGATIISSTTHFGANDLYSICKILFDIKLNIQGVRKPENILAQVLFCHWLNRFSDQAKQIVTMAKRYSV